MTTPYKPPHHFRLGHADHTLRWACGDAIHCAEYVDGSTRVPPSSRDPARTTCRNCLRTDAHKLAANRAA